MSTQRYQKRAQFAQAALWPEEALAGLSDREKSLCLALMMKPQMRMRWKTIPVLRAVSWPELGQHPDAVKRLEGEVRP